MSEKPLDFISAFVTAVANCSLYSVNHPAVGELLLRAFKIAERLFADDAISVTLVERTMFLNDIPLKEEMLHIETMRRMMQKKRIEKIIIKKGLTANELMRFVSAMASTDENIISGEHILVGSVAVKLQSSESDAASLMKVSISKVSEAFQGLSRFKRLDMVSLDEAVIGFITALKKESKVLRIESEVRSHSEYTYVHAANVAVLSIFQAESLGLKRESLYDIGVAGLLHDVGKMFIPKEIIEKQTKFDKSEWEMMKRHSIYGAMYLSTLKDVPKLAAIVAFEHHMRFDGTGYPAMRRRTGKPHLVSQILAVADFFDALRTQRPYRKALSEEKTITLMQDISGRELNPVLVDNFMSSLKRIKSA